jgi:LexA-binding, inner membrane-associated putative hydrolase
MASYRGHLMLSAPLGVAYGGVAFLRPEFDWGPIVLGAGLTTVGGLLPDLDSDSGVPVRELFGILAAAGVAVLFDPLRERGLPLEQALAVLAIAYLVIRYGVSDFFRRITVHRGMFHSLPAMFIAGLTVYHLYPSTNVLLRLYLAGGVMLGFLSHLVLDELCSVDFMGLTIRLNKFAGSALKFVSPSTSATIFTYAILVVLGYFAWAGSPPLAHQLPTDLKQFSGPKTPSHARQVP